MKTKEPAPAPAFCPSWSHGSVAAQKARARLGTLGDDPAVAGLELGTHAIASGRTMSCHSEEAPPYEATPSDNANAHRSEQDPRSKLLTSLKALRQVQKELKALQSTAGRIADDIDDALNNIWRDSPEGG